MTHRDANHWVENPNWAAADSLVLPAGSLLNQPIMGVREAVVTKRATVIFMGLVGDSVVMEWP